MAASLILLPITHTLCTGMSKAPALLSSRIWHNPSLVHTNKLISQTLCSPVRLHNINSLQKQGNGFSDPDPRGMAHAGFLLPDPTEQVNSVVLEINVKYSSYISSNPEIKNMPTDSAC